MLYAFSLGPDQATLVPQCYRLFYNCCGSNLGAVLSILARSAAMGRFSNSSIQLGAAVEMISRQITFTLLSILNF